jgi:hypothetical protein
MLVYILLIELIIFFVLKPEALKSNIPGNIRGRGSSQKNNPGGD